MAKRQPGQFNGWKGTYYRGSVDNCPPDHLADGLNLVFAPNGDLQSREGLTSYQVATTSPINALRMALYKPTPPFTGLVKGPRLIILDNVGNLSDINYLSTPLHINANWKDFSLVNFFGRCYITPTDGRVGLAAEVVYVYDGTGPTGFRQAAGTAPVNPLTASLINGGHLNVGTYLLSYAFETSSGFITPPAPFIALDSFGSKLMNITNLPTGGATVAARWLITCKVIAFRANLTIPFDVNTASFFPQYLAQRIGDNTTIATTLDFYDENLINSADDLFTRLASIPAGVGLIDFRGRMVSYGENTNPSLVRVSKPGNPESFDATSGFLITDPTDSTGVRCATEFRNSLYIFKQQRGIVVQDNGDEASTWDPINFEKAIGTEQYGIAALLDAKGSTSEGFLLADRSGIYFFNGVFQEPELTYKVRDWWKRITYTKFYTVQMSVDPINKRIYVVVPLDGAAAPTHILVGDFRDGLDPADIKWCPWTISPAPNTILVYNDFSAGDPVLVTRLASLGQLATINVGTWGGDDAGVTPLRIAEMPPFRYLSTGGISIYNNLNIRVYGRDRIYMFAYSMDKKKFFDLKGLSLNDETPGREYSLPMNLVSEQCRFLMKSNIGYFACNSVLIEGKPLWKGRQRGNG